MNKWMVVTSVFVFGLLGACGARATPISTPTATVAPSATTAPKVAPTQTPTATSAPTTAAPQRVAEKKRETRTGTSYTLDWSPDGKWLAAGSGGEITVLRADLSETLAVLRPTGGALGMTWSPDQTQFAMDVASGEVEELLRLPKARADLFAVSPDGKEFAVGDAKGKVQILDATSGDLLHEFQSVTQPVDVVWNRDGETLAILGYKTELEIWRE